MFDPITVGAFCFAFMAIGYSIGIVQCLFLHKRA
jgi:hypothetical protein